MESEATFVSQPQSTRMPDVVWRAHKCCWKDGDWNECGKVLSTVIAANNAKGAKSAWTGVAWTDYCYLMYAFDRLNKDKEQALVTAVDETIEIGEKMVEKWRPKQSLFGGFTSKEELNQQYGFYLDGKAVVAFAHFYKALYHGSKEEHVKAAYYVRASWKEFNRCKEIIEEQKGKGLNTDPVVFGMVCYGAGLFHLIMDLIPPSVKSLVELVGFEGDLVLGVKELNMCLESKCPRAIEATILLVMVRHFLEDNFEGAQVLLDSLSAAYPNAFIVSYVAGTFFNIAKQAARAVPHYEKTMRIAQEASAKDITTFCQLSMGRSFYQQGLWERSIEYMQGFIDKPVEETKKDFRPYTSYCLGAAYWMTSDNPSEVVGKICDLYNAAMDWVRPEESFDLFAVRKMKDFLSKKHFSKLDCLAITTAALSDGGENDRVLEQVEQFPQLAESEDSAEQKEEIYTLLLLYKGIAYREKKEYNKAEECFEEILSREQTLKSEGWVVPVSWVERARSAYDRCLWEECTKHLEATKKYKGYDWEKVVEFRSFVLGQKIAFRKQLA